MARRRRDAILVAGLLTALTLALVVAAAVRRGRAPEHRYDPRASTLLSGIRGTKAYYRVLNELGIEARRHFGGIGALPEGEAVVLALLSPPVHLRPREADSLRRRIEAGAGLLVTAKLAGADLMQEFGFAVRSRLDTFPVRPAGALRAHGVEALSPAALFFEPAEDAPEFEPLIAGGPGPVALTFRYGRGRVVAFADDRYFTNRYLRAADNGVAAVNAVAAYWPGPVVFDEFHQGFRGGAGIYRTVAAFLFGHPLGWGALQLALAGVALLYLRGRRLGAPRPPAPKERRSEMEHVEALAAAYESARACGLAAERIRHGLARRLGVHARVGAGVPEVFDGLEAIVRGAEAREWVRRLRASAARPLDAAGLVEMARAAHDIEEEVRTRWRSSARRSSRARR